MSDDIKDGKMDESKCNKIRDYKSAFDCFVQRFLVDKKSIFRLNEEDTILTTKSIEFLIKNFIEKGMDGEKGITFIDKIKLQLTGKVKINNKEISLKLNNDNIEEGTQKNAIEVLAHCVWLWRLVPYNAHMESTKKSIKEILELHENLKNINLSNNFFNDKIKGIASVGTYYNTNKPFELAFIIRFLEAYLKNKNNQSEIDLLNNLVKECNGKEKKDCQIYIKPAYKINSKSELEDLGEKEKEKKVYKSVSIVNALLHFFNPDNYEPIVSNEHKKKIVDAFEDLVEDCKCDKFNPEIDCKLHCIKKKLKEGNKKFEDYKDIKFFYEDEILEQWNPTVLPGKNVIYYGAPGTGKTHDLLKLVKNKVKQQCGENECLEEYYEVVQFHPSYSYEDFIDGIKPVKSASNINLELVDGVFKKMCQKAYDELKMASDDKRDAKKYYFIADEINRAELSRVFGELLLCLEEDKRLRFKNGKLEGVMIKTQNSSLWEEKNAVVKIDNECDKENGLYFGVPENLYFLATMNDIDKSIDSFDLALRRRFKWVYKGCDYDVIYNKLLEQSVNDDYIDTYISRCEELNNCINKELNLGSSYELGHSYFMNIKTYRGKIPKNAYENLFNQEIAPLLSEYLRAEISDPKELKKNIDKMKKIFTGENVDDKNS